jgi:hypothetical protein
MRSAALVTLVGLGAFYPVGRADDPPKPQARPAGPAVEVKMADGSAVRMTLTQGTVEITTKYGKLAIPAAEVRRIDFGFRYPDGAEARITELVTQLGDGNYKRRESAMTELLGFRELAYPALKRATRSGDAETAKRAAELVAKLEDRVPPEKLKFREYDLVLATDFTARGRIESKSLSGHTPYFGEVRLQVAEVRALRSVAFGGETTVQVDATKFLDQAHTAWLDTDVELAGDTPVEVVASGTVRLYPGQGYEATPKGHPSYVTVTHPAGALLGKVGESGEVFLIGEKYTGTPKGSGKLYLRLAPSPWPGQAQGSFKVTVTPNPIK